MKRWVINFSLAFFVFLVAYKHDVVVKIFVFLKDVIVALVNGLGEILEALL